MTFDYDLFVIGGGSGGVRAARVASSQGASVALAEEDRYGGTCVIRGCVPKKLMVFASSFPAATREARGYGWQGADPGRFDWYAFRAKLHAELNRLEGIYEGILDAAGVTRFNMRAMLAGPHEVELADGRCITAKTILVATGGQPVRPDLPQAEQAITSNEIFHLEKLPETMLIVGGGYIACEFAGVMAGLGVRVSQWYRGTQILRGFDDEARDLIAAGMRRQGVDIQTQRTIQTMTASSDAHAQDDALGAQGGRLSVRSGSGEEASFDQVLFAIGRSPNTANLGLNRVGVDIGEKGQIMVDAYSRTNIPSIYAIGDVTNRVNLTPVAIREAMAFVRTMNGEPTPVDHALIPSAVFTQPEFGTIGLSEEEAARQEPIEVYATQFRPMRTAFSELSDEVLFKLVVAQRSRRVLGCHIVAPDAGEMIQLAGIAVKMGATKEDFDRVCAVHPTMSEELVTMKIPVRTT